MFKRILMGFVFLIATVLALERGGVVHASPGGLIDGKPMTMNATGTSTMLATDDNITTYINGGLTYVFPHVATITSYRSLGNRLGPFNSLYVKFYDTNNLLLHTYNSGWTGIDVVTNVSVSNVKKVVVTFSGDGGVNLKTTEFDVFGTMAYPYPTNLVAASDTRSVDLTWTGVVDPSLIGYNVYRSDGTLVNTTPILGTSYKVTGLNPDTSYTFYLRAVFDDGFITNQDVHATATAWDDPPTKPVLMAMGNQTSIDLTWTSANATNFYLFYQNGTLIVITTAKSYTVTGLQQNTAYGFYVVAYDKYGRTINSDIYTISTQPPPPPVYPTITVSSKSFDKINIVWDAVGLYYDVYLDGTKFVQQNGTMYSFMGLQPDTSYTIQVVAFDIYGRQNLTNLNVTTDPLPIQVATVIQLSYKTYNTIVVDWNTSGVWYQVFLDGTLYGDTPNSVFTIDQLQPDTNYTIKVVARDLYGRTNESSITIKTNAIPPLAVITLSSVSVTQTSVRLQWTDMGAPDYKVTMNGFLIKTETTLFSTVSSLSMATNYTFKVAFTDQFGRLVTSNDLSVTTLDAGAPSPGSPGSLGGTLLPAATIPPLTTSTNQDFNTASDNLVKGAVDTKQSFNNMIVAIIMIIILVFGIMWLIKRWKHGHMQAASGKAPGGKSGGVDLKQGAASKLNLSDIQRIERQGNASQVSKQIKTNHVATSTKKVHAKKRRMTQYGQKTFRKN